jgi:hypothetical protein
MNGSISIVLPMSSITVQFPVSHCQNNAINFSCTNCIQHNLTQTNAIREEKAEIKEENNKNQEQKIEIKEENNKHEEDSDSVIEIGEYVLHRDLNLYSTMYSPISRADSEDITSSSLSIFENEDDTRDAFYRSMDDIAGIFQYFKEEHMCN